MRTPTSRATGWILAIILGALLAWYVFSDTPLRLGDRTLRVYDVSDLIADVPDFYDAPHFAFGERRAPDRRDDGDEDDRTHAERVADLAERVRTHVAPGTWGGGDLVNLGEGRRLLIVTSEAKHRLVQDFFEQVRATRRVQVTVEGRFITIGDGATARLDDVLEQVAGDGPVPLFFDDAQVAALLRAAQTTLKSTIITAPRLTVINGQRAYVLVATQKAYLANLTANRDANGTVAYDPTVEIAESGVVFETRATASADRQHVTLYLHPQLAELQGLDTVHVGVTPNGKDLSVQSPRMWVAEFHQTVTVPAGKTLLIRSMPKPRPPGPGRGGTAAEAPEEVVLLVKATVIDPARPAATTVPATTLPVAAPPSTREAPAAK